MTQGLKDEGLRPTDIATEILTEGIPETVNIRVEGMKKTETLDAAETMIVTPGGETILGRENEGAEPRINHLNLLASNLKYLRLDIALFHRLQ